MADQRRDGLHKLTTRLVREHDTIVIEDLHVAGMVRNHRLARAISQLGIAEFRRQIEYKATDAGVRIVVADRWYPQFQDVLGVRCGESQAHPRRTTVRM